MGDNNVNDVMIENTHLVKRETEELYGIMKSLIKNKNASTLILGMNSYLVLIVVESLNYFENTQKININYKYKNNIKSTRARLKPYDNSYPEMLENIRKLNEEKFNYFASLYNPIVKEQYPNLIKNIGITSYKGKMIDNTFLTELDNKKIIITNKEYDSSKTYNIAQEAGALLKNILKQINGTTKIINLNIIDSISNDNYNVYFQHKNLFKCNLDINCSLLLLNTLCSLNYYKYIIKEFNISNSLKYRIAYIVFNRTFNNLKEIGGANNLKSLLVALKKYEYLNNKYFRNKMFHYDIYNEISIEDFDKNEMYLGLISKIFNISEKSYIKEIDDYINSIPSIIEKIIFNNEI